MGDVCRTENDIPRLRIDGAIADREPRMTLLDGEHLVVGVYV